MIHAGYSSTNYVCQCSLVSVFEDSPEASFALSRGESADGVRKPGGGLIKRSGEPTQEQDSPNIFHPTKPYRPFIAPSGGSNLIPRLRESCAICETNQPGEGFRLAP